MTNIGQKIREAREYIGMTQEELATKMGYKGKSSISKIEAGVADIPQSKVVEFAKVLRTTTAFLMGWEDDEADQRHFLNEDTMQMAQELHDRRDLRMVFDSLRNASPEDLKLAADLIGRLVRKDAE